MEILDTMDIEMNGDVVKVVDNVGREEGDAVDSVIMEVTEV